MKIVTTIRLFIMLLISSFLFACAGSPPTQEMSDARQAVKEAADSGAGKTVPKLLAAAEDELKSAEKNLTDENYMDAKKAAMSAKDQATMARKVAGALSDAKTAITNSEQLNNSWRDTQKIYDSAVKAAEDGQGGKALKLAAEAQVQAENAVNQYYIEKANYLVNELKDDSQLTSAQKSGLSAAQEALAKKDGKRAYDIASKL